MKDIILENIAKNFKVFKNDLFVLEKISKEKNNIFKNYYNFINYDCCIKFIELGYNTLIKEKIKINNEDLLELMIIILKSFIEKKSLTSLSENYINSDDIFYYSYENYEKYLIWKKKYIPEKNIKTFILYVISILKDNKFIEEKIIKSNSCGFKTLKFYKIKEINYIKEISEYSMYSFEEFKLLEFNDKYYILTSHYSRMYELYKKNFNSNTYFKIKNINYIMNKINVKLYIDKDYQDNVKKIYNKSEIKIKEEIKELVTKINKFYEKEEWTTNNKKEISELQAKISKKIDDLSIINFVNTNFKDNWIIFPLFIDFRGRKYYLSKIGPTNSKILRLCFYYGWYNKNDFDRKNNIYSNNFKEKIFKFVNENKLINEEKYYETYYWCLIGIGKFFINKNKYPIKEEEFIDKGIVNFNKNLNNIEDLLEIKHYKRIMYSFYNKKIKKRTIIKDATASINQIFMKKLGPKNEKSLEYVNLGNKNEWFDTYIVCREKFYEFIKNNNIFLNYHNKEYFNRIFDRKLIKNTIMIIPYSAGSDLCWENYVNKIKELDLDIEINKDLKKIFSIFYKFIKNNIQDDYLYLKNTSSLINKINEEFETYRKYILESETGEADISYFKMKKSSIDKKYKINGENKRITKLILTPSKAIDLIAFNIASGANTAHFLDADEIRTIEIELGYCITTIHDSYLIDFNNCSKLINIKKNHYQKIIDKFEKKYEINNCFILL